MSFLRAAHPAGARRCNSTHTLCYEELRDALEKQIQANPSRVKVKVVRWSTDIPHYLIEMM